MSELAFVKNFLSTLDSRPVKLRPDYVHEQETPRASYLLPRLQPPRPEMPKKTKTPAAPGSSKSISITLKSARNPVLEFTLPNAPLSTTTISDLKDAVRERTLETSSENKVPLDKIKILYKRKPVTGTGKTVGDVLADAGDGAEKEVEFGVMVMGGARVVEAKGQQESSGGGETTVKAAVGPSGEEVLVTEQFWDDLQGYLAQRLKDEELAKKLRGIFGDAWAAGR
ncbi:cell-cycle control medial ring component [Aspergillus pseudoustus]|uniref:Cell-cycle control medial ring component n=1 Tax=Aspergillus pseudoustus TaxID=1810923 RepID=A0ABR4K2T8_9EURO